MSRITRCVMTVCLVSLINQTASASFINVLLEDNFSYANGSLAGNAGWGPTIGAGSLQVSNGEVVSPGVSGEHNGFHSFSRTGFLNKAFSFQVDVDSPTHNSVAAILLPTTLAQVGGWTYESTGWRLGGTHTTVTTGATVRIEFNPTSNTMIGSLLDLNTKATLFQSASVPFTGPVDLALQENLNVYLYADSRSQLATNVFDNLTIAAESSPVPEPSSMMLLFLASLLLVSIHLSKRQ